MRNTFMSLAVVFTFVAGAALADDNVMGFYFSDTEFNYETAATTIVPGYARIGYVVLTNAMGSEVAGYEVSIACTAADFQVYVTSMGWGENTGTNTNQIVHFLTPVPVSPTGTVLSNAIFYTESTSYEEITFGPSDPSSLPDGFPVVDFGGGDLQPCSYSFGTPVVARLNDQSVGATSQSWSDVKALFQ